MLQPKLVAECINHMCDAVSIPVTVKCNIHPWMTAYYFVMDHPYFAVTNEKGEFKIDGLPAGEYTLAAWHEEFCEQSVVITVGESGSVEAGFSFEDNN